ncbi:Rha family transcriptional regulator [Fusobacterium watanabei]|uniref:Rha family transcriptional regulator n=1 Tax=Fusobacterium watanabei TaxID=2686067 RepID=UPI003B58A523
MNFELKKLVLDSREVAKMLGKNHADLLRDVAKNVKYLIESKIAFNDFFQETHYKDKINRTLKRYDITKKGCEFLAHKLTGKKGAIFTATYINKFHEMEQALKVGKQEKLPFSEIKPTTWRGVPVMEVSELEKLTGIDRCLIHTNLRKDKITLRHRDFLEYKEENSNNYYASASSVSLLFKEVVIWICKKYGVYEKYKDFLENYFKEVKEIEYKNREYGLEHLRSEANKLKQKLLKEQFLITEKIQELDKTGLTDKMIVHRNNKNELILIMHFD